MRKDIIPQGQASKSLLFYRRNSDEVNEKKKQDRIRKKALGLCSTCSDPAEEGKVLCIRCRDKNLAAGKAKYLRHKSKGLCHRCGAEVLVNCKLCHRCWLRKKSIDNLGTETRWQELGNKLIAQEYICPYTGELLVPGINASVDHIFPSSLYPELEYELDNVEWVDMRFNRTKFDYTPDQFYHLTMAVLLRKFKDRLGPALTIELQKAAAQLNFPLPLDNPTTPVLT